MLLLASCLEFTSRALGNFVRLHFNRVQKNQLCVTSRDVRDFTQRKRETLADKTAYRNIAKETTIGRFKR